jgi:PAS domain S-box-containing protein
MWQQTPYTIPLILAAAISTTLALYILWRRRHIASSRTAIFIILGAAVWMFGVALELASLDLHNKIFWEKFQYFGICLIPTAWLIYMLQFIGREKLVTPRNVVLLSIVPLAALLLALTNESHRWFWSEQWLDTSGSFTVKWVTFGAGFWGLVTYSYIEVFLGILLLLYALVRSRRLYRWQATALFFAVVTPWVLSMVVDVFGYGWIPEIDLTPLALAVTVPPVAWSLYRLRRRDIVPVARDTVLEKMGDAVIVVDEADRIVDLNAAAQRLIGQAQRETLGLRIDHVLPEWAPPASPLERPAHEIVIERQGVERTYDVRVSSLTDWRGRLSSQVILLHDMTEAKKRTAELATLVEISRAVSSTLDLEAVLEMIAVGMVEAIGVEGCSLSRWDREKDVVTTWINYELDPEYTEPSGTTYALVDFPATRTVLETRQPLVVQVSDLQADPAEVALMREQGSASLLMLPLVIADRVIGLVELDYGEPGGEFSEADIRLCQALADQAAIAIENARLYAEMERQLREQVALREAGTIISSTLDPEEVLNRLVEQIGLVVDATSVYISGYDPETNLSPVLAEYISPQACEPEKVSDLGQVYLEEGDDCWLELLQSGQHDHSHVDDPDLPEEERGHMQQYGAKSILYVPILIKGQMLGYAEIWESRRKREFTHEEVALIQGIARQAAVAMENARLYEVARRRSQDLAALYQVGTRILATLDPKEVLDTVCREIVRLLDVTSAYVVQWKPDPPASTAIAEHFGPEASPKERISDLGVTYYEEGISVDLLQRGLPYMIRLSDPQLPADWHEHLLEYGARSVLILPMANSRDTLVYLEAWESRYDRTFTDEEILLGQNLTSLAHIAIVNARLYQQAQQEIEDRRQIEQQLRRYTERLRALHEIDQAIRSAQSAQAIARAALDQIRQQVPSRAGVVAGFDLDTLEVELFVSDSPVVQSLVIPEGHLLPEMFYGLEKSIEALRRGEVLFLKIPSASPPSPIGLTLLAAGIHTMIIAPLIVQQRLIGVLALAGKSAVNFSHEHIDVIQEIASSLAVAIQQASLREQLERHTKQLEASLQEKELLLKEIHHRVKNNMQVVSSLLNLQAELIEEEETREMFLESRHRIRSMALVHERLYQTADFAGVDFGEYLRKLTSDLYHAYKDRAARVSVQVDVRDVVLGMDLAVPCGLIVNELVSNAFKHAFPQQREGKIRISLYEQQRDYVLIVEDDGVGLSCDVDFQNPDSLGLQLVLTLVEQMEGEIEVGPGQVAVRGQGGGLRYKLSFAG